MIFLARNNPPLDPNIILRFVFFVGHPDNIENEYILYYLHLSNTK
jgi:hypothetical protein